MMKRNMMVFVLMGAAIFALTMWLRTPVAQMTMTQAPDAAIVRIGSGEETSIAALSVDRPLYLNFWASWCPPCVGEMPYIDALYKKYEGQMNFACVSLDSSEADARAFFEQTRYSVPLYYGDEMAISKAYDIQAIPVSILIAPGGKIIETHVGGMDQDQLEAFLNKALK